MHADVTPSTGLRFRSEWLSGMVVALVSLALLLTWLFWGRALLFGIALAGALAAIAMLRYLEIGSFLSGFLITGGLGSFLPGSTTGFFAGMLIVLLLRKLMSGNLNWRFGAFFIPAILFIAYYQASGLWVDQTTFYNWSLLIRVLPAIVVMSELFDSSRHFLVFFVGCAIGMTFTSVSAIQTAAEFYTSGVADKLVGQVQSIESSRFYGHWADPNIMSMTLTGFLGGVIALWRSNLHWTIRLLMLTAVVTSVAAVLMSLSRSGLVTCTLVIIMMLAIERRRIAIFVTVGLVVAVVLTLIPTDIFSRVELLLKGEDVSSSERVELLKSGWALYWKSPMFGGGMGSFENNTLFILPYLPHGIFAHNTLVDIAVDGGIIAVLLMIACFVVAFQGLNWSDWRISADDIPSRINAGLRAGLVASVFSMLTMSSVAFVPFWMLMTICAMYPASRKSGSLTGPVISV